MLVTRLHPKRFEYKDEDENIIQAERFFNQVPGEKLQRFLAAVRAKDPEIECQGKSHPEDTPSRGSADGCLAGSAVENAEVQQQQEKNSGVESYPEAGCAHGVSVVRAALE
jgi:hypothetical protein